MFINNCRYKIKLLYLVFLILISVNWNVYCYADTQKIKANSDIELLSSLKNSHNVSSVAWHPDENLIATGGQSNIVTIWNIEQSRVVKTIDQQVGGVGALVYSPDGKYLAVGRTFTRAIPERYHINIYDAVNGNLIRNFIPPPASKGQSSDIKTLSFSLDSKLLAANAYGTRSKGVVYDVVAGKVITTLENFNSTRKTDRINSLSFSPDGNYLAVGHGSGTINIWLISNWKLLYDFTGHEDGVYSLAFSPDSNYISVASKTPVINVWDVSSRKILKKLKSKHVGYVRRLQYSSSGKKLVSGGSDYTVMLFNMEEPYSDISLENFTRMAFPFISPNKTYLAVATGQNVELWKFIE